MAEKDLQKVKELIALMKENDLVEVEVADGDSKIHLKRPGADARLIQYQPMAAGHMTPAMPPYSAVPAAPAADAGLLQIKSPIVGTFYQAPNPDTAPYIKVGDTVGPDSVVCIVEAMKVMNEIKAELAGTVVEICCKDGQAIEFGQTLFKVRP
jgi:acetyl-CoA carboxylase biotin carboxyl carrier protein